MPHGRDFDKFHRDGTRMMPDNRFHGSHMDGFGSRYSPFGRSGMMGHGNFFFSPFSFLFRIAFLGLAIWLIYKLVTGFKKGNGWQLSYTRQPAAPEVVDEEPEK